MKSAIEQSLEELECVFKTNIDDFFFTEKELHSYFLNICFSKNNVIHKGYLLVHAEYPTPFKCSYNDSDIVKLENDDSKKIRAHIDMVFLNSNYIDWINTNKLDNKYISGIPQANLFNKFNNELTNKYESLFEIYKEPILIYAIEFKYLRHGYLGTKHPIKGIIQDLEKLRILKKYPSIKHRNKFSFVENTLSVIFIGERGNYIVNDLKDELKDYQKHEYKIITKN